MTIILVLFLILAVAGLVAVTLRWLQLRKKSAQLEAGLRGQKGKYDSDIKRWRDYANALKAENQRLAKWEGIADADAKAGEILQTAQATFDKASADAAQVTSDAQQQAASFISGAQSEASTLSMEAREKAKAMKDDAQAALSSATTKAAEIIQLASKRAEEIAGSAYEAMNNAALYERTVHRDRSYTYSGPR